MQMKNADFSSSCLDLPTTEVRSKSSSFEYIKKMIAEKLHGVALELSQKSSSMELEPNIRDYGKELSHWLDKSAEYVEHFDKERMNARI